MGLSIYPSDCFNAEAWAGGECVQGGHGSGKECWVDPPNPGLDLRAHLVPWGKEKEEERKVKLE